MTEVTITALPQAPLHALEIWANGASVAARIKAQAGLNLPTLGRSAENAALRLIRVEPTVWLAEGDVAPLEALIQDDGALTAIGGGVVKVLLEGPGWRRLLMEGGVFDAEDPAFGPGCSATTIIDHVNVRLHVKSETCCEAWVPASYAHDMLHFWEANASAI